MNIRFDNRCRIFVDGANPSFISVLKDRVDEDPEYVKQIAFYKHNYPSVYDLQFLEQNIFVIPVAFNKELAYVGTLQGNARVSAGHGCYSSTLQ